MKNFFNDSTHFEKSRLARLVLIIAIIGLAGIAYPAITGVKTPRPIDSKTVPASKPTTTTTTTTKTIVSPQNNARETEAEVAVSPPSSENFTVAGWLPFWDTSEGIRVVREFPAALDEVSPFWYKVTEDGGITSSLGAEGDQIVQLLRSMGKRVFPTISGFDGTRTASIINDSDKRAFHVSRIVELVAARGYDGIDIDYESLRPEDRDAFSLFLRELSAALHARDKKLITTVHAKTDFPGSPGSSYGHDYQAIGEVSDQVRIMAYDQHYSGGPAGPIASLVWVTQVIDYAVTKIPPEKIVLGVPAFGYDWPTGGGRGKSVVHDDAAALSLAKGAQIRWDDRAKVPYFNYDDGGTGHVVWFENYESLAAKVDLARRRGLGGVVIWRLGREDKQIYQLLSNY